MASMGESVAGETPGGSSHRRTFADCGERQMPSRRPEKRLRGSMESDDEVKLTALLAAILLAGRRYNKEHDAGGGLAMLESEKRIAIMEARSILYMAWQATPGGGE